MSINTYRDLLNKTSELVGEATEVDETVFATGVSERSALYPLLSELRVRYTMLLARLDTVYDQLLQPQSLVVRRLLEACLGRLIEIKHDLVELHLSDYTYDDEERNPVSRNNLLDKEKTRRQFVDDTLRKLVHEPAKLRPLILTEQQAVLIIQSLEKARHGRLRGQFIKEIRLQTEKAKDQTGEMTDAAATAIKRVWRGFLARRETKRRKREELLLIGMELPPHSESQQIKKSEEVKDKEVK